jgi:hypothetical protein
MLILLWNEYYMYPSYFKIKDIFLQPLKKL